VVLSLFSLAIHLRSVKAAAGDLDPTFGMGGRVTTDFFGHNDSAQSAVIQLDGKIVVVGAITNSNGSGSLALIRYNTDGSLDPTFGAGGEALYPADISPTCAALQPNGDIVVAGGSGFRFGLQRYHADGSLDVYFGSAGTVRTIILGFTDVISDVSIQPDGKIIAVGVALNKFAFPQRSDFALARYNSDGSLDPTFGAGGKVTTDFAGLPDMANAVAVQGDGKIVVVGASDVNAFFPPFGLPVNQFSIARYNADGSLDSTFGSGGRVRPFLLGGFDQANSVACLANGKIIVAGVITNHLLPSESDFGLIRLNGDGTMDIGFGSLGIVTTDFSSQYDSANHIALQSNGNIVLAGIVSKGRTEDFTDFAVARYHPDGSLDTSFGSGGKVTTDFFGFTNVARVVLIQQDNKIVAVGTADRAGRCCLGDFALARYDGNSFDTCLQDDSNRTLLQFNSTTGEYLFTNCGGFTLGGIGLISSRGNVITLQQNGPDRRLFATVDASAHRGTASIQVFSQGATFTITDRSTLNDSCACAPH
jgi:uncharacterized delta-60 repeat protein